jgi:hypothetical protein
MGNAMRTWSIQRTVLLAAAGAATLLLLRAFFLLPVRVEVDASREIVNANDTEPLRLEVRSIGRAGCAVPFRDRRLRCEVAEGAELVRISYAADSTELLLAPTGGEGRIILRIHARCFPLPLLYEVHIGAPLAGRARLERGRGRT